MTGIKQKKEDSRSDEVREFNSFPPDVKKAARHVGRLATREKFRKTYFLLNRIRVCRLLMARKAGIKAQSKCAEYAGIDVGNFSRLLADIENTFQILLEKPAFNKSAQAVFYHYWLTFLSGSQVEMVESMRTLAINSDRVCDKKMYLQVTDNEAYGAGPLVNINNSKTMNINQYQDMSPKELLEKIVALENTLPAPLKEIATWSSDEDIEDAEVIEEDEESNNSAIT